MHVNVTAVLSFLTGGGLLAAAARFGAAVRDFRAGFEALQQLVNDHVSSPHAACPAAAAAPAPENTSAPRA